MSQSHDATNATPIPVAQVDDDDAIKRVAAATTSSKGFMAPLPQTAIHWGETRRKSGKGGGGYFGSFSTAMSAETVSGGVAPLPAASTQWGAKRRPSGGFDSSHRRRSAPARSMTEQDPLSSPTTNDRKQPEQAEPAPGSPPSSPMADDAQQLEVYAAGLAAVTPARNVATRAHVVELHTAMIKAMVSSDLSVATSKFQKLRETSSSELMRLADLSKVHSDLYKTLGVRYDFLVRIDSFQSASFPSENGKLQQHSLDELSEPGFLALFSEESRARLMLATAETHEAGFREAVAALVFAFNKAQSTAEICTQFKLDASAFPLELRAAKLRLSEGSSDVVVGRFADVRRMRMAEVPEKCASLNRATLIFADPFVMALCYTALAAHHRVVQVLNTHSAQVSSETTSGLVTKIDLDGWLVEVELVLREHDAIKQEKELSQEIGACANILEVLDLAALRTGSIGRTVMGTEP